MGVWGLAVQVLLPVPLIFLVLLCTPTPHPVRKFIIRVCKTVLAIPAFGVMSVFQVGMIVSALAFASSVRSTYLTNQRYHSVSLRDGLSPCEKTQQLADKWRQERNFWIAAMCFLLWVVLSRVYSLNKNNMKMRDQVKNLGGQPPPDSFQGSTSLPSAPGDVLPPSGKAGSSTSASKGSKKTT